MQVRNIILALVLTVLSLPTIAQTVEELEKLVAKTDVSTLPYDVSTISIRMFDGDNPPPRLKTPERPLFYGYGMTAYSFANDSLSFFYISHVEAVHRDKVGKELKRFKLRGNRFTIDFKDYYLKQVLQEERSDFYFQNVYLKDKKGNYLKLEGEFKLCPHCP